MEERRTACAPQDVLGGQHSSLPFTAVALILDLSEGARRCAARHLATGAHDARRVRGPQAYAGPEFRATSSASQSSRSVPGTGHERADEVGVRLLTALVVQVRRAVESSATYS